MMDDTEVAFGFASLGGCPEIGMVTVGRTRSASAETRIDRRCSIKFFIVISALVYQVRRTSTPFCFLGALTVTTVSQGGCA